MAGESAGGVCAANCRGGLLVVILLTPAIVAALIIKGTSRKGRFSK